MDTPLPSVTPTGRRGACSRVLLHLRAVLMDATCHGRISRFARRTAERTLVGVDLREYLHVTLTVQPWMLSLE
jgi:hypothetical protein